MGLDHLEKIESFLKDNKDTAFTISKVKDSLGMNYHTVSNAIAYFLKKKKLVEKPGNFTRYQWK